jgi:hypothetical protein
MKVDIGRLCDLLGRSGFAYHRVPNEHPCLVRRSVISGLFEAIVVRASGKHGEAVYAYAVTSITQTPMFKTLGKARIITEIAEVAERGWTIIRNRRDAIKWEEDLGAVADRIASNWSQNVVSSLLEETEQLRQLAAECITNRVNTHGSGVPIAELAALAGVTGYVQAPEVALAMDLIPGCSAVRDLDQSRLTALVHLLADRLRHEKHHGCDSN